MSFQPVSFGKYELVSRLAAGGMAEIFLARTKSIQIALTWSSPLDQFTISHLRLVSHGRTIAAATRVRKLKTKVTKSATFTVLSVSNLSKGTLRFTVKAARIGSGHPKVTLTTQVRQSRTS